MPAFAVNVLLVLAFIAIAVAAAIAFGGPAPLPPMQSVNDPFRAVDFTDLPAIERFPARDGTPLAYRKYGWSIEAGKGTVVLIHGSSSRSNSMHAMARGLSGAGYVVYVLDMRGHGESGKKGQIDYIGQLEDDIEDFILTLVPPRKTFLVGFSAGGGFSLRFAAGARRGLFDGYVLLSPFLGQTASTYRPASGGWVSVGVVRLLALLALNRFGIKGLNHLPVTAYSLEPEASRILTPRYSYSLAINFRPHHDYKADISSANLPMEVIVGEDDDQFHAESFASEFSTSSRRVPVTIVPDTTHMGLTLSRAAIEATSKAIARLGSAA